MLYSYSMKKIFRHCVLLFCLLLPFNSFAKEIRIYGGRADIEITLNFNEDIISEKLIRTYADIHPMLYDFSYAVTYQLELCIQSNKSYFRCGTRNIHDMNFFKNAEVNLQRSRADLDYLENLPFEEELFPLVNYFKKCIEFGIWKNEALLKFYQTWDIQYLKSSYGDIDTASIASEAIQSINASESHEEKYRLARKMWSNAVNRYFRNKIGKLPGQAWDNLLKKYNIEEEIIQKEIY
jgi:hypothetical protein